MANQFVGHHVSITCVGGLGHYQGCIENVNTNGQKITLVHPYKNGLKCDLPQITLCAQDICDLVLLDGFPQSANIEKNSKKISNASRGSKSATPRKKKLIDESAFKQNIQSEKPLPKPYLELAASVPSNQSKTVTKTCQSPSKASHSFREQRHPYSRGNGRYRLNDHREGDCFNIDDSELNEDFDFEKNLALFDKNAVYDELFANDNETRPQRSRRKSEVKYRHDENVISNQATVYRQIITNEIINSEIKEFYTDSGLVIPCISSKKLEEISDYAIHMGITLSRQLETFGLGASQMSLNVLGGNNRLHPRNSHQLPHVVVIVCPHMVGAKGLATARCLANQNVQVHVFVASGLKAPDFFEEELKLLSLSEAIVITELKDLPRSPVELVITAFDQINARNLSQQQHWYKGMTQWCNKNMAPILCLCPSEFQDAAPQITAKWSVCSILPQSLPTTCGIIYLLDLNIPPSVFKKTGIKYQSPFCSKPFIALHSTR